MARKFVPDDHWVLTKLCDHCDEKPWEFTDLNRITKEELWLCMTCAHKHWGWKVETNEEE